jgi:glycosyltransferase involved in cell wall biosynthesis
MNHDKAEKRKVSVIMLTYQRAALIMESIQSVLQQSYADFELLIIDDGSTDHTASLIGQVKDPRVQYFPLTHIGKIPSLRNFGMAKAQGEYIAFLDSDDLWETDKLKKQVTILTSHPEAGFTFSEVEEFNESSSFKKNFYGFLKQKENFYSGRIFEQLISNRMAIYPSSVMFRKSCFEKTGLFDESLSPGDSNFLIRLSFEYPAIIVFEHWTKIRKHEGNVSSQLHVSSFKEMEKTITLFFQSGDISKKTFKETLLGLRYALALDYWRKREYKNSRKELLLCILASPLFLKAVARYFLSYFKT